MVIIKYDSTDHEGLSFSSQSYHSKTILVIRSWRLGSIGEV